MNMFYFFIISFLCFPSFAQKGFYLGFSAGYGFSIWGKSNYDYTYTTSTNNTTYMSDSKYNPINLGQGFFPSLQAGYFFNPYLGIEIGVGYLFGTNHIYSLRYDNEHSDFILYTGMVVYGYSDTYQITSKMNSLFVNPSLIFKIPLGKLRPYIKTGLILGAVNTLTSIGQYSTDYASSYTDPGDGFLQKNKIGPLLGLTAEAGLEVLVQKHIGVFGELYFRYAGSWIENPSSNSLTDPPTYIPGLSGKSNLNPNKHFDYIPLNAVGFSIGLRYYFNKN